MIQPNEETQQIRSVQFITIGKQEYIPAPLIRITTCGLLTVEIAEEVIGSDPPQVRYASLTPEQLRGRGTGPALMLLKLLLSRPERFASRAWLIEQFCRDGEIFSSVRIDNIVSQLRGLLCPPAYQALRKQLVAHVRNSGSDGYQLAASPLIWCDQDALAWNIEQATRMERFHDNALPFWERAYELARRGPYLPGEVYNDWATFRREEVAGMLRQSVQALARIYQAQHGAAGEEEALRLLRSYWLEHPHEEDILRPLMELLGRRECTHEALKYYEQLCEILKEDEREPDTLTKDVVHYLRNKQVQRHPISLSLSQENTVTSTIESANSGAIISSTRESSSSVYTPARISIGDRRNLWEGAHVGNLETSALTFPLAGSLHTAQEILEIFTELLETAWELSQGSKLKSAEMLLWSYLPKVATVALQFPQYQQRAADLTAQGYILAASLIGHRNSDLCSRQYFSEQAFLHAQLAANPSLQVAALRALGVTFDYQKRPAKVLQTYQQTIPYLEHVSPLLRARMYALLAGAYAKVGQKEDAFASLDQAYRLFPEKPQDDPSFLYADAGRFTLVIWDGSVRLDTYQPKQALEIFSQAEAILPQGEELPKRIQSELFIYQTRAYILLKDLEAASASLREAVNEAIAIQSEIRYQQAYELFSQLQVLWPQEPDILSLKSSFLR